MRYPTLKLAKTERTIRETLRLKRLERARKVLEEAYADTPPAG